MSLVANRDGCVDSTEPRAPFLALHLTITGDRGTIAITGEVDYVTSRDLRRIALGAMALGVSSVELDCSEMTFMDVGGLRVLAELADQTDERGGSVTVTGAGEMTRIILEVVGLDERVTLA